MRVDTCPAYTAARAGAPGFGGMQLPGESMVSALADYDRLDLDHNPVRIRLKSTAVRVEHIGPPAHSEARDAL